MSRVTSGSDEYDIDFDEEADSATDQRPRVCTGIDVHRVLEDLDEAMGTTDQLLYQRSNELVLVVGSPTSDNLSSSTPILRPVTPPALLPRVTEHVNFVRKTKPDKQEVVAAKLDGGRKPKWPTVKCVPPPAILTSFISRVGWTHIRTIRGVTGCPFLRPDGSIMQDAGFDVRTGYLYTPNAEYPRIPDEPTQADAKAALADLVHVFCDFPHVSDADRMVPIAAIMTVIARPGILGSIPAFIFDASTRGSGKTLQCDVVSAVATGRPAERQSFPDDDVELEKTLCSYALAGLPIVLLDNVTRVFGGGPLDKVITARGDVSFRELGGNKVRTIPWVSTLMASGNGIDFMDDTARRVLVSRLESDMEQPETREEFVHPELISWVVRERPRLVASALTILRAYTAKGSPNAGCARWGSFEEWSRLIPPAIVFAGGADPMSARPDSSSSAGSSRDTEHFSNIVEGIWTVMGSEYASASQIVRTVFSPPLSRDTNLDALREAIRAVTKCKIGADVDPALLGIYMRGKRGRVTNRMKIEREETESKHRGSARWRVENRNGDMGDGKKVPPHLQDSETARE